MDDQAKHDPDVNVLHQERTVTTDNRGPAVSLPPSTPQARQMAVSSEVKQEPEIDWNSSTHFLPRVALALLLGVISSVGMYQTREGAIWSKAQGVIMFWLGIILAGAVFYYARKKRVTNTPNLIVVALFVFLLAIAGLVAEAFVYLPLNLIGNITTPSSE